MSSLNELFKVSMIDPKRKIKIAVQLRDKDGDEIKVADLAKSLTSYIKDMMKQDENNHYNQQVIPMMAHAMIGGMAELFGDKHASIILSNVNNRYGLMYMMATGFCMLKWIQQNEAKIHTVETKISDDEIDTFDRITQANDATMAAATMGINPQDMIKALIKTGRLKISDIAAIGEEIPEWLEDIEVEKKETN